MVTWKQLSKASNYGIQGTNSYTLSEVGGAEKPFTGLSLVCEFWLFLFIIVYRHKCSYWLFIMKVGHVFYGFSAQPNYNTGHSLNDHISTQKHFFNMQKCNKSFFFYK